MNNIEVGRVVVSTAGRDKGCVFIVFDVLDENYVLIADGKKRKIACPKKKKIKHLRATAELLADTAERVAKKAITDAELNRALNASN